MPKRIALTLVCALLLCSCNVSPGIDGLLSPPRLTAEQSDVYDALEMAVGTDAFKLKYPRRGDFLSACILHDIDRDGAMEALAFYELTVAGDTSTWMSVLSERDGVWKSIMNIPGDGTDVDLVDFAAVTSDSADNIIVGWSVAGRDDMVCAVYSYNGSRVDRLTKSDAVKNNNFTYSEMLVTDVDADGLEEIILCTRNAAQNSLMRLVKYRSGRVVTTSDVRLPAGLTGYSQLLFGPLTTGMSAVFADITLSGGGVTTKIAVIDRSIISELTEEDLGIYESFDRPSPTLNCADVNGDGFIDIPLMTPLPGYEEVREGEKLYLTEYKSVIDGSLTTVMRAVVNFNEGYLIRVPESWVGQVTVRRQTDASEWRFVLYDGDLATSTTELLRVKAVSPGDYQDKFETAEYRRVAVRGAREYLAHIPPGSYPGYSLTHSQLESLFSLL